MRTSKLQSKTCALIFSLLIVLSSLSAVNLPLETEGAVATRGEENTLYVDDDAPDGGDGSLDMPYQKIQDAVNASENWDTVRVFAGTYNENVLVNKTVNLVGNGSEVTTIKYNGNVVWITADNVNLSGFMVPGSGNFQSGIIVESNHNIISNNNCSNNYYGIYLFESSDNTLTNNTASDNLYGINLRYSSDNTLTNNIANSNNDYGIYLYESNDNTLTDNTASDNYERGIYLYESNDNTLTGNIASDNDYGIYLYKSSDNTLTDNTANSNNAHGIHLDESSDNTLTHNTASDNYAGIYLNRYSDNNIFTNNTLSNNGLAGINLYYSDNNILNNNTCSNNSNDGIRVFHSNFITLTGNTISNNDKGIYLSSSIQNTLSKNHMEGNGILIWGDANEHYKSHNIDSKNTVNGKPVRYHKETEGITVPSGAGQIIIVDSKDMLIKDQNLSNSNGGILIASSSNITIQNNTSSNNYYGIYLYESSDNTITNNICSSNDETGISVSGNYNIIKNNTCSSNGDDGIALFGSYNTIIDNTVDNNYFEGIYISRSDHNDLTNNTASNNRNGFWVWRSNHNTLSGNTADNNNWGIQSKWSNKNDIISNTVTNNSQYGIYLYTAVDQSITDNTVSNNGYGIYSMYDSDRNTITNNTVSNNGNGIFLSSSSHNTLEKNQMIEDCILIYGDSLENFNTHSIDTTNTVNGKPVRYYKNSNGTTVPSDAGQIIISNSIKMVVKNYNREGTSILVGFSSNITIKNNNFSNSDYGIRLRYSNYNIITNNTANSNGEDGIDLSDSNYNIITNNTANSNGEDGIDIYGDSNYNMITHNNFSHNRHGIILSSSSYNTFKTNSANSNSENGIFLISNSAYNNLTGNTANSNGESGIELRDNSNILTNNSFSYNTIGIHLRSSNENIITHCTISGNEGGILLEYSSSDSTVQYNNIFDNTEYGINATDNDGYSIDATHNWWGDASGPYHPENNSEGKGNSVTDFVEFDPWIPEKLFNTLIVTKYGNDTVGNGTKENPFLTIQKAVADSNNWDSIRVFEGVYEENVVVDKSVEIIGNGSRETVIQGLGNGNTDVECSYIGSFGGSYNDVTYDGEYLYAAHGQDLSIFDVSDPKEIGFFHTNSSANSVAVSGGYAYVADDSNGLLVVVDVSDPTEPQYADGYDTDYANSVAVSDGYAYVANGGNGLIILELHFPPDAALHISADNVCVTDITVRNGSRFGILIDADDVEIEHCQITGNNDGVKVIHGSENIEIHNCNIFENNALGINSWENDGKTINAINNWWGHPSGPYHPTLNPDGIGNEVSNYVIFDPWLNRPINFRILHVAPDGNDLTGNGDQDNPFGSIQKTIDLANEWDTIQIAPGTYSGSITVNKRNVTIIGDSPSTTIIDAGGGTTAGEITADDVEVIGFSFRNATENGILIVNSSGVKIIDCAFPENSYDLNLTNSKNIRLINTTFETVNFNDASSSISVLWPVDLKGTDNRSGFVPNAHLKLTDTFGTTIFDGYSGENGIIPQINVLDYYQDLTSRIEYNPSTISIRKNGYLNFAEEYTINTYTRLTCQLQTHILPESIISGELMRYVDMDSLISFDGSASTGRSITYLWEFGDGEFSVFSTPSHTYTSPGAYQVNLTVTDDYDNTSTASIAVIIENVLPTAQAESDTDSVFEDEPIEFTARDSWDTLSDSLSFLWGFGDGSQSTEVSPIHAYQDQGEYDVRLTVVDLYGGESTTITSVTVTNIEPWIVETNVTGMHYPGKHIRFSVTADDTVGDAPNLHYSWDFGDGTKAGGQNITHAFTKAESYDVIVTVTDNNGASDFAQLELNISDPAIDISVSSWEILQDGTIYFNASHELDDGSFVYTWYFGEGTTAVGKDSSHTYDQSGIFSPRLIIDNGIENVTIFLQEIVVNNVVPTPQIIVAKIQVSEDESIHLDASSSWDSSTDSPHLTYVWDFGDGSKGSGITINHAYPDMGSYTVLLTVSDGKSTNSTQVEIEVENLPPTADAGTPKERQATVGIPMILDASQSLDTDSDLKELNYTWKIGDKRICGKTVSYTFETSGSFSVILEVRDNNGTVSEDTLTIDVSKSSESEDEEIMSTLSWILVVIIIVFLVIIGFLLSAIRDEALYREMKEEEEAIVVEGEIDDEMFKPKDDIQETTVEVVEEQDGKISDAEEEAIVVEGEMDDDLFKPPDDVQKATVEVAGEQDGESSDVVIEIEEESESASNGIENGER